MTDPKIKQKMLKEAERVEARMNKMKPGDPPQGSQLYGRTTSEE